MKPVHTILAALLIALSACGEKVSHATLEDTRAQSAANALFNAQMYRAANPRFDEGFKLVQHADTAISPNCPQGSGWAELSLMKVTDKVVDKTILKCSTHSASLGCYRDQDYEKKSFAGEEGHCQSTDKVPFPLPKLAK